MIAAPTSGAGKTTVTLGLLAALRQRGVAVAGAKLGPDYIDPTYHAAATGRASLNLDGWAMSDAALLARFSEMDADLVIVEGAMGALDGSGPAALGSSADMAERLELPIVLVIDCAKQAQSAALAAAGLCQLRPRVALAGVILNRIASDRHLQLIRPAFEALGIPILGAVRRQPGLTRPERHLGLVPMPELEDAQAFLSRAAETIGAVVDLDALQAVATPAKAAPIAPAHTLAPLGRHIAIARDAAFAFAYPHHLKDWEARNAQLSFFSPLAGEGPDQRADAIFLPGGYPELHGAKLASAGRFRDAMCGAADRGVCIYGECGGYMTLGEAMIDSEGQSHRMLGLLPLTTSFAERKLSLGHRDLAALGPHPFGATLKAHEFHYATVVSERIDDDTQRLFEAHDSFGRSLGAIGLRRGSVMGSFAHVICAAD
ncbi:MAG: cobyrinate a,c-diamide synthase [Pseudomonadota bacterium]